MSSVKFGFPSVLGHRRKWGQGRGRNRVNGAQKKTEAWKLRGMQKVLTDLADNGWGQGGKSNCDDKLLPRPSWDANWPLDRAEPVFLSWSTKTLLHDSGRTDFLSVIIFLSSKNAFKIE